VAPVASAQWSGTPWNGVRYLERTDPGPVRVRAMAVDLCAAGMTIRASRPAEANQVVSAWGSSVEVQAAVNANMWHCGDLCGVGIGNGEAFDSVDDGHWGYLSFSLDAVDYPWDYDAIPPAAGVEQAVGGHPRIVNAGAPIPEFAGNCLERHPRTAAGFSADRQTLYLAVVDGRSGSSVGMTCAQLASLMVGLGAHEAINLDGGGSSTMWLSDRGVVNQPSDGSQRVVRNHLGIRSHGEGAPRHCVAHRPLPPEGAVLRPLGDAVSAAWGFSLLDLRVWEQPAIDRYERGPALEAPRLIQATGDPAIYLVDRGFRRHVPNPRALRGFHLHTKPVEELSRAEVDAFPEGPALTQFPTIAVTPAPDHTPFLVDHRLPDPPEPGTDAGPSASPDAGPPPTTDGGVAPPRDASSVDGGGDAAPDGSLSGGCATTPVGSSAWLLLLGALALRRRARRVG
jgi:hypothetical protein